MLRLIFIAAVMLLQLPAQDPQEKEVLATVQKLFDAMASKDVGDAAKVLHQDGVLFVQVFVNGGWAAQSSTVSRFLESFTRSKGRLLERIWNPKVQIEGTLAHVWAPYDFHIDGKLSHCGTNSFQLVMIESKWKIATMGFTMQQQGCGSPLGPPR
jgi:hypothetical protein